MNFKNRGTNHRIHTLGVRTNTMIIGADVTHPDKDADEICPSMAGIVASEKQQILNREYTHYLASARLQNNKDEHIEHLKDMMHERLLVYYEKNRFWPEHILFYRDGVSESQYGMVKTQERRQITEAVEQIRRTSIGTKWDPKITLVVVGNRQHTRFYPMNNPQDQKSLITGHVMDTNVVIPHAFNFYLQSQDSALGTDKPAHYVVPVDESQYGGEKLQKVTNDPCSMGLRAMHALSVCTPARYADFLCDRLRMYMKPVLDGKLDIPAANALGIYRQNKDVWGLDRNTSNVNPWHGNVKDVMFYL